jgi:hypothetical protein
MGTTLIERLFAQFDTVSGKFMRVIGGRRADAKAQAFLTNTNGSMLIEGAEPAVDAFARLRVATPFGTFDAKQVFDNNPNFYTTSLVGGGTGAYQINQSATLMGVTAANGDSSIRQSLEYIPYQAGRSQLIFMTGVMGALKANVRQRIGYFDSQNGIFFEQDGTNLKVVVRSFTSGVVVDTPVNQSAWNMDRLDGAGPPTNPSGITINMAANQIFVFDFEWLSAGRIRFGFVLDGKIVYCHQVLNANIITVPWSTTPALPVRWELANTAASASPTSMLQICASVFSEGGFDPLGLAGAATSALPAAFNGRAIAANTPTPIMSIRLKAAYNRAALIPKGFEALATTADNFQAQVFVGGTLSGGAAVTTSITDAAEMVTGTNLLTGGRCIAVGFGSTQVRTGGNVIESARVVSSDFAGTPELITLILTPYTNATLYGALTWREIY